MTQETTITTFSAEEEQFHTVTPEQLIDFSYEPIDTTNDLNRVTYPVEQIGVLSEAVKAIARVTKKDEAMAGQAVIATLAGATQARYCVRYFDDVGKKPLSLFTLTIAKSAHGKSHVSSLCNKALRAIQDRLSKKYKRDMNEYNNAKKGEIPLDKPSNPLFIFDSGTIEGLIDVIERNGYCYALIDEMATMLGGHSAKPENVMKLLGSISSLWSNGRYSEVKRGDDDPRQAEGDLTFSANGQPQVIKPMFTSPLWREQGTIPRFLVCEPPVKKMKRVRGQKIDPKDQQVIDTFNDITRAIFDVTPCSEGKYTVAADEVAEGILTDFYNEMIKRSETDLAEIESYALRATEHVGRLAGLLCVYRHHYNADPMDKLKGDLIMTREDALAGVDLMRYYLHEYNRLSTGDFGADVGRLALELFEEIKAQPKKWQATEAGIVTRKAYHDNIERYKSDKAQQRKAAFKMLVENGYLKENEYIDRLKRQQIRYIVNHTIV